MKKKIAKPVTVHCQGVDLGILQTELANARKNAKASANALSRAEDLNSASKAALATAIEKLNAASRAVLAAG
jgi:hypothetical protein